VQTNGQTDMTKLIVAFHNLQMFIKVNTYILGWYVDLIML